MTEFTCPEGFIDKMSAMQFDMFKISLKDISSIFQLSVKETFRVNQNDRFDFIFVHEDSGFLRRDARCALCF